MVPYGAVWSPMILYGPDQDRSVPYGPIWSCMVLNGPEWSWMVQYIGLLAFKLPYCSFKFLKA